MQVLARGRDDPEPREAPPACWITRAWPVEEDTIVDGADWAFLAWSDARGRLLTRPQPAFYQHVFGPNIPAYTIRTPALPGSYRLIVLDSSHRRRASFALQVVASLAVSQPEFPAPARGDCPSGRDAQGTGIGLRAAWELTLVNTSSVYIQAQVFREHLSSVSQTHPGMRSQWIRASDGGIVLRFSPFITDRQTGEVMREIPMPQDLPPGVRLKVTVPADRLPTSWANRALKIEPSFTGVGQAEAVAERADLKISIEKRLTDVAADADVHKAQIPLKSDPATSYPASKVPAGLSTPSPMGRSDHSGFDCSIQW